MIDKDIIEIEEAPEDDTKEEILGMRIDSCMFEDMSCQEYNVLLGLEGRSEVPLFRINH